MRLRQLLSVLLIGAGASGCRTELVIVHPTAGIEQSHGGRSVSLRMRRARLLDSDDEMKAGALAFQLDECVAEPPPEGKVKAVAFRLSFRLENDGEVPWDVTDDMFDLENVTEYDFECKLEGVESSPVGSGSPRTLISVTPGSVATIELPFVIYAGPEHQPDLLKGQFRLTCAEDERGERVYLQRRVDLGTWWQAEQGGRAFAAFTVLLYLGALLL